MSSEVRAQQTNVQTAMNGIAAAVCSWRVWMDTTDHRCSQKICIRYIPKLSFERRVMILGASERFMQENIRNVPAVRQATLIVQKFQPISSTCTKKIF